MKTCRKCHTEQSDDQFRASGRDHQCKSCKSAYQRKLRQSGYKPTGRNKRLASLSQEGRALHDLMVMRCSDIQDRLRRFGGLGSNPGPETLVQLWHQQGGKCGLTGRSMNTEANSPWVASVDKIKPELGYVEGNMQLTCWAANRAKGDLSLEDFEAMCFDVIRKVQRLS